MRTIKFRALAANTKEWVYGNLMITKSRGVYIKSQDDNKIFGCGVEVLPETVGQFTGLIDKNGKEIYEGDLVQHNAWNYPFKIIFNHEYARFVCELKTGLTNYIDCKGLEVIGNIHEGGGK